MTEGLTQRELQEMAEIIKAADAEISALCNGKKWRMSIPAQPDTDSDLVISAALCVASELLKRQLAAFAEAGPPDFWRCLTCGCLWRDNHDDTVSLGSAKQTSCVECEMKPSAVACEPLFRDVEAGRSSLPEGQP